MRKRRTKAELEAFDDALVALLAEIQPQTVRHVFYRVTDPRLGEVAIPKTEAGYRALQDRLAKLRRWGRVPYGWLVDSSRMGWHVNTWGDAADFIRAFQGHYRAPLWRDVPEHVEVWSESRSLAGVLRSTCQELAVSLYPCGGFPSLTLAYEAAVEIKGTGKRRCVIVYLGDYDPAGVLIERDLIAKLRGHLQGAVELECVRTAVTREQVEDWDLPTKPRKAGERRLPGMGGTVEAEAIDGETLRDLVRTQVEAYLPERALEVAKEAEQSEREHLARMANVYELERYGQVYG